MIDGKQRLLFIIERMSEERGQLYQENPIITEEEFIVAGAIILYNCRCHKNGQTQSKLGRTEEMSLPKRLQLHALWDMY